MTDYVLGSQTYKLPWFSSDKQHLSAGCISFAKPAHKLYFAHSGLAGKIGR